MHDDGYDALPGKRKCYWHDLLRQPIEDQILAADERASKTSGIYQTDQRIARMPKDRWPAGERWCSVCQGFIPLFYAQGSRCKAHNAAAAHSGRLAAIYDITRADYLGLLELQGGVCAGCGQKPGKKRLAVDHDHKTGRVRGLLCADADRGCNHAVLGSIEARSVDGPVAGLRRLIDYLEHTPYDRLKETTDGPTSHDVPDDSAPAPAAGDDLLRAPAPDWD